MASDQTERLPWKDDAINYIGCNFAYGDLSNNLPRLLTVNGRVHAETFVAASGAIAGFAAQQALLAQKQGFSIDALNESSLDEGLFIVRSPRGDRYIYGDHLNEMIFCKEQPPTQITARLWEWATAGAVAAGLDKSAMPDTMTMWQHVNRSIEGDMEGMPSVPKEHWPHLAPVPLMELLWPTAKLFLTGKGSGAQAPPGIVVVEPRWWPSITGMVASAAIQQVHSVLNPRTALIIAMETAIFTLKVDPTKFKMN
jgi:hypothetical protein